MAGKVKTADEPTVVDGTAEEFKPSPGELVVRPDVPDDVFRAMDAHDELQILEELEGRPAEVMVYSFTPRGAEKAQTGLSWAGVAEVVRTMNEAGYARIRVSPEFAPVVKEPQETNEYGDVVTYVEVTVYAEDQKSGGGNFGTARQQKFQTFRDESKKPRLDKFAYTKALSKAQRNAMLPLTPVVYRETLIARLLHNPARVKELRVGMGDPATEMPPPLTDDRAKALKTEIRGVFRQVRDINPMALMPGGFHAKLANAEHEHERLEEFLGYMRGMLEHVQREAEKKAS